MLALQKFEERFKEKNLENTEYKDLYRALQKGKGFPGSPASKIQFIWFPDLIVSLDFFDGFQARKGVTLDGEPLLILFRDSSPHERKSIPHYYLCNPHLLDSFHFSFDTVSGGAKISMVSHFLLFPLMPFRLTSLLSEQDKERKMKTFAGLVKLLISRLPYYTEVTDLLPYLHPRNLFFDWDYNFVSLEFLSIDHLSIAMTKTMKMNKFFPQLFLKKLPKESYSAYAEIINALNLLCAHFGKDVLEIKCLVYPNTSDSKNLQGEKVEEILRYDLKSLSLSV